MLAHLDTFDLAVPVSPAAVRAVFTLLPGAWPAHCTLGLVGPGSRAAAARALTAHGQGEAMPAMVSAPTEQADSEGLWQALNRARPQGWNGTRVLILRGGTGREWLAERMQECGAQVQRLAVYRREAPVPDAPTLARLREVLEHPSVWLFSASEAVRNLDVLLHAGGFDKVNALAQRRALATHPRIAQAARAIGFGRVDVCVPDDAAIVDVLRAGAAD